MLGKTLCTFTYVMQCTNSQREHNTCSVLREIVTYLIAEVMYFPLHFSYAGVQCLPHRLPAHASFIPVFVIHVPAVPNLQERLIYTYQFQRLFLRPNFLTGHVRHTGLNYTGFLLVQVAAEIECGASLHGNRKCYQD